MSKKQSENAASYNELASNSYVGEWEGGGGQGPSAEGKDGENTRSNHEPIAPRSCAFGHQVMFP